MCVIIYPKIWGIYTSIFVIIWGIYTPIFGSFIHQNLWIPQSFSGFPEHKPNHRRNKATGWCPPVISLFINLIHHTFVYHKP